MCSERKGSRKTATTRVGSSSEKPAGRGVDGICLRTVAVPMDACLEILFRVMRTFADPSPPSSSSTVCMMLSLQQMPPPFSAVRFGLPDPNELLRRMGRFWLRKRSNSARSCEFSCSNSPLGPGPRGRARLAERVVIWGAPPGWPRRVWFGPGSRPASGRRCSSSDRACCGGWVWQTAYKRSIWAGGCCGARGALLLEAVGSAPTLRRRAQSGQSPTTGFKTSSPTSVL